MRTLKEAARIMKTTPTALTARIERGNFPQAVKVGGRWYVPDSALEAYKNTITVKQASDYLLKYVKFGCVDTVYNRVLSRDISEVRCFKRYRVKKKELDQMFDIPERIAKRKRINFLKRTGQWNA